MKVMVLAGGPDREREVSLVSGAAVTAALREAGHDAVRRDIGPDDTGCLDDFLDWHGDVVFPALHGRWGEGGGAQALLEARGVKYVGCREAAGRLCFDKTATKQKLTEQHLPTPGYELIPAGAFPTLAPPVVLKPNDDGSSIDLAICHDRVSLEKAWADLTRRNGMLLVERFVKGRELTVGVLCPPRTSGGKPSALDPIQIVPATGFYDYEAKYVRDDTQYLFDVLPPEVELEVRHLAERVFEALGCRHLSRVDLFLDEKDRPWVIEVNTMPGFTGHSLLPMAAGRAGMEMPVLVDELVRWAAEE